MLSVTLYFTIVVCMCTSTAAATAAVVQDVAHVAAASDTTVTSGMSSPPPCSLNGVLKEVIVNHNTSSLTTATTATTTTKTQQCVCDKPWSGPNCETMRFKPVSLPQGYGMRPAKTTWGGNVIFDNDSNKYHLFVSAMTNNCTLQHWGRNSRIEHAISDTMTGPYVFSDIAIPTWSHNAAPVKLADGTFAIFHIGDGTGTANGGDNCTLLATTDATTISSSSSSSSDRDYSGKMTTFNPTPNSANHYIDQAASNPTTLLNFRGSGSARDSTTAGVKRAATGGAKGGAAGSGSTIHVSKSLSGPWSPLSPNTLGGCNNPAPWVHPNGTLYCLCSNNVLRAESIHGPWTRISSLSHTGGPVGNYEDPFLYTDARGHFHLIYHVYNTHENPPHGHECVNATVSAHAYSEDGFQWFMSSTQPYTTQVALLGTASGSDRSGSSSNPNPNPNPNSSNGNGSSGGSNLSSNGDKEDKSATDVNYLTVATRERPKIWFDTKTGQMTHLINGACLVDKCPNGPATGCVDCKYANPDATIIIPFDI
eukprot:UC1_evm2s1466